MSRRSYKGISINTSQNTHEVVFQLLNHYYTQGKVLDLPCGAGAFTQRLLDHGYQVYSSDIENFLQLKNENFKNSDMNLPLPYQSDYLEAVVCIDGIEHLENQFSFVRETNRILKKDGIVIISTPNISSIRSRIRWFLTGHHHKCKLPLEESNPNPLHHIGMISFHKMRYILHSNNYQILQIRTNRIKWINWIYMIFFPLIWFNTWWVYRREKNPQQRRYNQQILKQMMSISMLCGETMIIAAKKVN